MKTVGKVLAALGMMAAIGGGVGLGDEATRLHPKAHKVHRGNKMAKKKWHKRRKKIRMQKHSRRMNRKK